MDDFEFEPPTMQVIRNGKLQIEEVAVIEVNQRDLSGRPLPNRLVPRLADNELTVTHVDGTVEVFQGQVRSTLFDRPADIDFPFGDEATRGRL